jgi:hypothetical protein
VGWNSYNWYIPEPLRRPETQRNEMATKWLNISLNACCGWFLYSLELA